jgi:hypothetical protein
VSNNQCHVLIIVPSEVENFIRDSVQDVVVNFPSLLSQRDVLVDELLRVLENDASWVELYGITGELIIPAVDERPGERGECLDLVKRVLSPYMISSGCNRCSQRLRERTFPPTPSGEWHEILIPVDVPRMTVSPESLASDTLPIANGRIGRSWQPPALPSHPHRRRRIPQRSLSHYTPGNPSLRPSAYTRLFIGAQAQETSNASF